MATNDPDLLPKPTNPQPTNPVTPPPSSSTDPMITATVPSSERANPANVDLMAANAPQAVTGNVASNQTTKGQLHDLLSVDSPYMQQARAAGLKAAASRGLQNSTMAAQAGEQAAISQALPIAQQDAKTYQTQALTNQQAQNQFGLQTAGFQQNQALSAQQNQQALGQLAEAGDIQAQQNAQKHQYTLGEISAQTAGQSQLQSEKHAQTLIELAKQGDVQAQLQLQKFGFDTSLSAQDNVQRLQQLAAQGDLDAKARLEQFQYSSQLSSQQSGQQLQQIAAQGQVQSTLQSEKHAQTLIELAKQGDIQSQLQLQKYGFDSSLSAQDNLNKLAQLSKQGNIQAASQLSQFNYDTLMAKQKQGYQLTLGDQQFQNQTDLLAQQLANSKVLNQQDADLWVQKQNVSHADTLEEIKAQVDAQSGAQSDSIKQQAALNIQSQYLDAVAKRQNFASQEIMSIYQTQGLTSEQQENAVGVVQRGVQADLDTLRAYFSTSPVWDKDWLTSVPGNWNGYGSFIPESDYRNNLNKAPWGTTPATPRPPGTVDQNGDFMPDNSEDFTYGTPTTTPSPYGTGSVTNTYTPPSQTSSQNPANSAGLGNINMWQLQQAFNRSGAVRGMLSPNTPIPAWAR